jgi:hypothetical protein
MPVSHYKGQAQNRVSGVRHLKRTTPQRIEALTEKAKEQLKPATETHIGIMEARRQAEVAHLPDAANRVNAALSTGVIEGAEKVSGGFPNPRWQIPQSKFTAWLEAQLG